MAYKRSRYRTNSSEQGSGHYDAGLHATALKVHPGDYIVSGEPSEMLVTTLGSCVAACIRDPRTGFGGMNHFMLPSDLEVGAWAGASEALRYGNHAMEVLINAILARGCPRQELEVKVFGGANVCGGKTDIGASNARFVLDYLEREGIEVAASDLGGRFPRRLYYFPVDGTVKRLLLRREADDTTVRKKEKKYREEIGAKKQGKRGGTVTMFED